MSQFYSQERQVHPLRIAGFGACMITGYPHDGSGMFDIACELIKQNLSYQVDSTLFSLAGFPAPRAEKHLQKRVLKQNPDYIIMQFGATDAQRPIRNRSRPLVVTANRTTSDTVNFSHSENTLAYHAQAVTWVSILRWELASFIGKMRQIESITPLDAYIASIKRMVIECQSEGIKVIVVSPFLYGSRYTTIKSAEYTKQLEILSSKIDNMIIINCRNVFENYSKSIILQHDGFHLSKFGQRLVGEAIAARVLDDLARIGLTSRL